MDKYWRVVPWIELKWHGVELQVWSKAHGNHDLLVSDTISGEWAKEWRESGKICYWTRWLAESKNIKDMGQIKAIWNFFTSTHLLLEPFSDGIWLLPKPLPPLKGTAPAWAGFPQEVTMMGDEHEGRWLEVPAARGSLWVEDPEIFSRLTKAPTLDEGRALSEWGFDGRGLAPNLRRLVPTQDWLWWESLRFNYRSGPLSRTKAQLLDKRSVPEGEKKVFDPGPSNHLIRGSRRDFNSCQRLTSDQLLKVLVHAFKVKEELEIECYQGKVGKLYGPSGGCAYESIAWVWVGNVEDLEAGLYRFDGKECALRKVPALPQYLKKWEEDFVSGLWPLPQGVPHAAIAVVTDLTVLLQMYERIAFQLAHVNAGIRLGELINIADSMELTACAIGGGVMRDLALNWGGDPYLYGPLAEIVLGGKINQAP